MRHQKHISLWFLLLTLLFLTAFIPIYTLGVSCIRVENNRLIAIAGELAFPTIYASEDGGLNWHKVPDNLLPAGFKDWCQPSDKSLTASHPNAQTTTWRITDDHQQLDKSIDDGKTWQTIFVFPENQKIKQHIYGRNPWIEIINEGWPYNMIFDPSSENLVISMGADGILVIEPNQKAHWISVGANQYKPLDQLPIHERLSFNETMLAILASFLSLTFLAIPLFKRPRIQAMMWIITIINSLTWLLLSIGNVNPTGQLELFSLVSIYYASPDYPLTVLLYISVSLTSILGSISAGQILFKSKRKQIYWTFSAALLSGLLYTTPYLLYYYTLLPTEAYIVPLLLSLVLSVLPTLYTRKINQPNC